MADVAVDATVGQQAAQVQGTVVLQNVVHGIVERIVIEKAALLDGFCNFRQLLIDDAPSADVQVADLGISHLPFWKAYSKAAGLQLRVGPVGKQTVKIGRIRL